MDLRLKGATPLSTRISSGTHFDDKAVLPLAGRTRPSTTASSNTALLPEFGGQG
jgi:hypothetical protein